MSTDKPYTPCHKCGIGLSTKEQAAINEWTAMLMRKYRMDPKWYVVLCKRCEARFYEGCDNERVHK